jgi:hypothetical protein
LLKQLGIPDFREHRRRGFEERERERERERVCVRVLYLPCGAYCNIYRGTSLIRNCPPPRTTVGP